MGVETAAAESGETGLLEEALIGECQGFVGGQAVGLVGRPGAAVVEMAGVQRVGRTPLGSVPVQAITGP